MNAPIAQSNVSEERHDWFVTASGRRVFILDPKPEDIWWDDISHALSLICRFGGHTSVFYSVAQHSVLVSNLVPKEFARHALIHDATEAYLGDVIRPLKALLPYYKTIEDAWEGAIAEALSIEWTVEARAAVKAADRVALVTERRDFIPEHLWRWSENEIGILEDAHKLEAWTPHQARELLTMRWITLQ